MKQTFSARERGLLDRPAQGLHFTDVVDLRDFLRVHLAHLTPKQSSAVVAWANGTSFWELAAKEGVSEEAIHDRLKSGLRKLRRFAR